MKSCTGCLINLIRPVTALMGALLGLVLSGLVVFFGYMIDWRNPVIEVGLDNPFMPSFFSLIASIMTGAYFYMGSKTKGIQVFIIKFGISAVCLYSLIYGLYYFGSPAIYIGTVTGIIAGAGLGMAFKRGGNLFKIAFLIFFGVLGIGLESIIQYWGSILLGTMTGLIVGFAYPLEMILTFLETYAENLG